MNIRDLKQKLDTKEQLIGRERYKITGVLLPIFMLNDECHLMFNIRSQNIPQPGEVCFPGGKFDPKLDETTKDTALRETTEELGIDSDKIDYIGSLGHYIAPMGVLVDAYVAKLNIDSFDDLEFNRNEVEQVFALPINQLKENPPELYNVSIHVDPYHRKNGKKELLLPFEKLGIPKRYDKPWGNIKHRVFVYENDPVIWGITAELLHEFLKIV